MAELLSLNYSLLYSCFLLLLLPTFLASDNIISAQKRKFFYTLPKLYIYTKYSKHLPYTMAHTIDCVCNKMLNHGLNHGLFISLFKLIPCPIH